MSGDSPSVRVAVRAWTAASWALLTVTIVYVVSRMATLVLVVNDYHMASTWVTAPSAAQLRQVQRLVDLEHTLYPVVWLLTALYVVGNLAWSITAGRVARRRGQVLRHWSLRIRNIALIAILVIPFGQASPPIDTGWDALRAYALRVDIRQMVIVAAQILLAALVLVVVWFVRRQVNRMLSQPPVAVPNVDGYVVRGPLASYRLWRQRRTERVYD